MEEKEQYKTIRLREGYWKEVMHLSIELNKTMAETVKYLYDYYKKYDGSGIKKGGV